MKHFYIAAQVEENGKFYAYVIKASNGSNLLISLDVPGVIAANIFHTRKEARLTVDYWNDRARENGNYMFSETF